MTASGESRHPKNFIYLIGDCITGKERTQMEYVIDTHALRVRLAVDGRTHGLIARDAKLPVGTIDEVLEKGKAEKDVIDKIRLAVRPKMFFGTICPKSMQHNDEEPKTPYLNSKEFKSEVKRHLELQKKLIALCNEYSTSEVFDLVDEWEGHITNYLAKSGFDLLEILDEAVEQDCAIAFDLDSDGNVVCIDKRKGN